MVSLDISCDSYNEDAYEIEAGGYNLLPVSMRVFEISTAYQDTLSPSSS